MSDALNELKKQYQEDEARKRAAEKLSAQVCPACGACPTCGRRNVSPSYPQYPWPNPVWYGTFQPQSVI